MKSARIIELIADHLDSGQLLELFRQIGVVSNGHFLLSSGKHSNEYWEKFRLLEWPVVTQHLCEYIVSRHHSDEIDAVVGPTTGGALIAQEVARQMNTRCLIAEPALINQGRELRRGFQLSATERVLIVDDVLTTGLSLRETLAAVQSYGPTVVGIEVLIDRSGGRSRQQFTVPCQALLTIAALTYDPKDCPLCANGVPLVKPGTREISGE